SLADSLATVVVTGHRRPVTPQYVHARGLVRDHRQARNRTVRGLAGALRPTSPPGPSTEPGGVNAVERLGSHRHRPTAGRYRPADTRTRRGDRGRTRDERQGEGGVRGMGHAA